MTPTSIISKTFKDKKESASIISVQNLCTADAALLREHITKSLGRKTTKIYIDARTVNACDLSGINEIIHSNYILQKAAKKMVLVYQRQSIIEKWVKNTGIDKFMATAIIPQTAQ